MAKKDKKDSKSDDTTKSAAGKKSGTKGQNAIKSDTKGSAAKAHKDKTQKNKAEGKAKKARKSEAKALAKASAKTSAKTGTKAPKPPKNPREISTGKGAGVAEIANALMDHLRSGKPDSELWAAHFSPKFMSIEGIGQGWKGVKAVQKKCDEWMGMHTLHSVNFEGPYVGATGFVVKFFMDVTNNNTGQRIAMTEVGVYTVEKGKVVQEEFMYFAEPTTDATHPEV